jgi:hypothetical protein
MYQRTPVRSHQTQNQALDTGQRRVPVSQAASRRSISRNMNLTRTTLWRYQREHRTASMDGMRAVSLHSHSDRSRETLDFVPAIARRLPIVASFFERGLAAYERVNGHPLDFSEAYWRPPLAPAEVIASERQQIERRFGCGALVSLTDHDTFEGPRALRTAGRHDVPLSVEWSVPFAETLFHLGVHAIPPRRVDEIERELSAYTAGTRGGLAELLDWLGEDPDTFVVLNHPCWDLCSVGARTHDSMLLTFLRLHRERIHALELNGYRSWTENRRVLPLAEGFGLPVVGGGDRHGFCPNTILNLTQASCLAEFARELRTGRPTECVILPEYEAPYTARVLQTAAGVLRDVPHERGRVTWKSRVFLQIDGEERALESIWTGVPFWLHASVVATRMLGTDPLRRVFALSNADGLGFLDADCETEGAREIAVRPKGPDEVPAAAA